MNILKNILLQDMGGKHKGPAGMVIGNLPIQIFRALEIQSVDRFIQKKQLRL